MRTWVAGLGFALASVVAIGGLVVVAVTSGSGTAIVDLEVGDCFELPPDADGTVEQIEIVDCSTPHLAEVVHVGELNAGGDPYPADDDLFALADAACRAARVVESDAFGLLPIAPSADLWESFDGRFLCVAIPFGGDPVTGSARTG